MTKKYVLALIALSSLGTLSHADYQIRIPIQHAISFNGSTSGGSGGNGGGGLVFTDPTDLAAYDAKCGSFPNKINPISTPVREQDISCGDYANKNLSGYVLDATAMTFSNFQNSILDGAILGDSDLSNSNLSGASLIGAQFTVNGKSTALTNSNMSNSNMTNANLEGAYLEKTNLAGANLTGANLNATFVNANLSGANLIGADLTNSFFNNVDLTNILYDATTKWPSWYTPPKSSNGYQATPAW